MYTLGIDCHKKYSQVAVLNNAGELKANLRMLNDKEHFTKLLNELNEPCCAVIEAGYSWGTMYDLLTELGVDVTLAHALKVKAIASAKIKTDTIDANTLAELLHANLIPEVFVPPKDVRQQKNILRQRCWLVKFRTMLKNRIHQVIDRNHIQSPVFSDIFGTKGRKFLDSLHLSNPDQDILLQDLKLIDFVNEQIKLTEKWIDNYLKDNPYRDIIKSIPGFGKILSSLTALEICDITRFPNPSKLASYSGLVPSTYASGGKVYHGDLMPSCNRWLRYAFIEAAWVAITTSPYFRSIFDRIKKSKGSNTAIVVIARKISEILYLCLKNNRNYEERIYYANNYCFK